MWSQLHGWSGHSHGCSGATAGAFWLSWHCLNNFTLSLIAALLPGHQTTPRTIPLILEIPGWPACSSCRSLELNDEGTTTLLPRAEQTTILKWQFICSVMEWLKFLVNIMLCEFLWELQVEISDSASLHFHSLILGDRQWCTCRHWGLAPTSGDGLMPLLEWFSLVRICVEVACGQRKLVKRRPAKYWWNRFTPKTIAEVLYPVGSNCWQIPLA
jgi:hypothetical protein